MARQIKNELERVLDETMSVLSEAIETIWVDPHLLDGKNVTDLESDKEKYRICIQRASNAISMIGNKVTYEQENAAEKCLDCYNYLTSVISSRIKKLKIDNEYTLRFYFAN